MGDQLGSSVYAAAAKHRYSVAGSQPTPRSSYSSDSGYSDAGSSHSSAFGGQTSAVNAAALAAKASSSYTSNDPAQAQPSELGASSYASTRTSSGLGRYSAGAGTTGNQVTSTFAEYSDEAGGHGSPSIAGLTNGDRGPAEYSTSSHPSSSYITYPHGGPKPSMYNPSGSNHRGHGPTSYSSYPSISSMSGGHHGGSGPSYYPSESGHSSISSGNSYSSGPSLSSILNNMHSGGPSNYIHGSSGHRPSPNHIYTAASNPNPSYLSRVPSSGYFSSSPYSRGGGKIILVKESGGVSGGHGGHMYPGEQHNYNNGMFVGASRGYKIRSVASGPSYGLNMASGYTSSGGYAGSTGHPSSNHGGGGLFGFL